jgi:hypothetical protein
MNNYEQSSVIEVGPATDLIRGAKIWAVYWIDSLLYVDAIDLWVADIDETDD